MPASVACDLSGRRTGLRRHHQHPITTPAGEGLLVSDFVDSGKPASVTVPAGQLQDGETYKFRTNACDGTHYNLSGTPGTQFVVDTTAPGEPTSISSATYPENWGGGAAGVAGRFDVTTGASNTRDVQYRLAPYEDDAAEYGGWSTVPTTLSKAVAAETTASFSATPADDGNHVMQTRSVDRADNVGPIKDYGFTAGNRDYNRQQKIDIKLPTPDTSSQDPEPTDAPQPPPAPSGSPFPQLSERSAAVWPATTRPGRCSSISSRAPADRPESVMKVSTCSSVANELRPTVPHLV